MEPAFCFIACVNDEEFWSQCREHIAALEVPPGYTVEVDKITGADSMAQAYDDAMRRSDAQYKVYLHQDTFVLDRRFLFHLLRLFTEHPEIGLIGMQGGTHLPRSGVWFHDGLHSYGSIMRFGRRGGILNRPLPALLNPARIRPFHYLPVRGEYLPVLCVDGLLMATQYDVPWRTDLYGGFIWYEAPQCLEFIKRGYEVVVPRQEQPWCLHWGADRGPEEDRAYHAKFREVLEIFRAEYAPFIGKSLEEVRELVYAGVT
ncbi:MAG: glycosyltransferase family protein [Chitinophagales bacterium]